MATIPGHKNNLVALRRIEGQIRGVQRMIEEGKYCIDILNQIQAVKGALARIEDNILKKHLQGCVAEAIKSACEKEKTTKIEEVLKLIRKVRKG